MVILARARGRVYFTYAAALLDDDTKEYLDRLTLSWISHALELCKYENSDNQDDLRGVFLRTL